MTVFYNEIDKSAAAWLRELIVQGNLPAGQVDERPIEEIQPDDLRGFVQCHFFAGVGGWPLALRYAGWPEDRPVWTGSCPCQPYSAAGAGKGDDDPRNLWWAFRWHIAHGKPPVVFGEQVASKDGRRWFAGVRAELETLGYAVGCADLCAAGAGPEVEGWFVYPGRHPRIERTTLSAPHIRQRLFWVAESDEIAGGEERQDAGRRREGGRAQGLDERPGHGGAFDAGRLADTEDTDRRRKLETEGTGRRVRGFAGSGALGRVGNAGGNGGAAGLPEPEPGQERQPEVAYDAGYRGDGTGFDIVHCADGKARRIESGSSPLAHEIPERVGRLRGYGNAIDPVLASQFIEAYREAG